jgi:signal transduction histidine kinase
VRLPAKDGSTRCLANLPTAAKGDGADQLLGHPDNILDAILGRIRQELWPWLTYVESRLTDRKLASIAEFAAGAAHEINTPLAVIVGEAQHLRKRERDTERRKVLDKIVAQAKRIHEVLRDLLIFAAPPRLKLERVSLGQVFRQAWGELRSFADARKVRLLRDKRLRSLRVVGDRGLLTKALVELLRNAIEAAPPGGWVNVHIGRRAKSWAVVTVLDSGPGFSEQQRQHLFDPFYSGRSAGRGKGLGLAKVWRISQLHGGRIEAHADPGQPTRFELMLPVAGPAPRARVPDLRNGHPNTPSSRPARQ